MDVPCYDLTKDEEPPQLLSHADGIQLTVSRDHNNVDTYGKETHDLLERVCLEIKYGKEEPVGKDREEHFLRQAQKYTGLHRNVIYNLWKYPLNIDHINEIDRMVVYNELMMYNLEKNVMPTTTDLFNSLQLHLPPYLDIRSFRNILVKMGYIFKKTNSDRAIVIENPAMRFDRYMYLKNLKRYRQENRPIYFVCEGALAVDNVLNVDECERHPEEWQHRFICAISSKEVKCFKHVPHDFNFENWILETLVECKEGSVIVVDNSKHFSEKLCEIPKQDSLKCDMIEWLEYNQIPFSNTMCRLELWMLIEKYTDINSNVYKLDNLVKSIGCEVQRLPDCLNNLTPTPFILKLIQTNLKRDYCNVKVVIKSLENIIKSISEKELSVIESSLVVEETRLLELDTSLDYIMDKLRPSVNPEFDTCLPSISDLD